MKYGVIPTNPVEWLALQTGQVPLPVIDSLFALIKARVLMAGVRLGLFDAMADGVGDPKTLAGRIGADASCLEMLLRALVVSGYAEHRNGSYVLSPVARRTLVSGSPQECIGYVQWNYTQWEFLERLEDLMRTGKGIDFHDTLNDGQAWGYYQRAMLELARRDSAIVAKRMPIPKGAARMIDIAGSHGLFGAALCRRHPPMRSTVIDLPQAIPHARALAEAEGIADLVQHRAGNLLTDDLGEGFDAALLSNILHHFLPDVIQSILSRVRRAVRAGGVVAIWENERPPGDAKPDVGDVIALYFRLTSTAGAYSARDYQSWLTSAGFTRTRVVRPLLSPGSVLVIGSM